VLLRTALRLQGELTIAAEPVGGELFRLRNICADHFIWPVAVIPFDFSGSDQLDQLTEESPPWRKPRAAMGTVGAAKRTT
jgi:hypothetical protein